MKELKETAKQFAHKKRINTWPAGIPRQFFFLPVTSHQAGEVLPIPKDVREIIDNYDAKNLLRVV